MVTAEKYRSVMSRLRLAALALATMAVLAILGAPRIRPSAAPTVVLALLPQAKPGPGAADADPRHARRPQPSSRSGLSGATQGSYRAHAGAAGHHARAPVPPPRPTTPRCPRPLTFFQDGTGGRAHARLARRPAARRQRPRRDPARRPRRRSSPAASAYAGVLGRDQQEAIIAAMGPLGRVGDVSIGTADDAATRVEALLRGPPHGRRRPADRRTRRRGAGRAASRARADDELLIVDADPAGGRGAAAAARSAIAGLGAAEGR